MKTCPPLLYDPEGLVEGVADAEHRRPGRYRAGVFRPFGCGECVIGAVPCQDRTGIHALDVTPVAVEHIGQVGDIEAEGDRVALAFDVDIEILREAEIQRVIPRHHSPSTLGVFTDVVGKIAVLLDKVPERLFVLV